MGCVVMSVRMLGWVWRGPSRNTKVSKEGPHMRYGIDFMIVIGRWFGSHVSYSEKMKWWMWLSVSLIHWMFITFSLPFHLFFLVSNVFSFDTQTGVHVCLCVCVFVIHAQILFIYRRLNVHYYWWT